MADELNFIESAIPTRLKRLVMIAGAVLAVLGLPAALNFFCIAPIIILSDGSSDIPVYVLTSLIIALVTFGAGGLAFWHANQSLKRKPSKPIKLPSLLFFLDIFGALLIVGLFVTYRDVLPGLLIPPLVFLAAALPSLGVISLFIPHAPEPAAKDQGVNIPTSKLTWRRGIVAFAGGASISLVFAIALEILLPAIILALGSDLFSTVTDRLNSFFSVLGRTRWTGAWTAVLINPGFIYILLYLTLIAPLVEEFAKPLVTLPILRYLNRQDTFLIGAITGAGFAILENSIYATIGVRIWIEFLFVRALGCAIQPLGSGLVALGWRDVLRGAPGAWGSWSRRFGIAVVIHAAWNIASLLVVFLGEALIAGNLLRRFGLLEIAALGMLFIFLCLLGSSALWFGRALGQDKATSIFVVTTEARSTSSNRTMAIWAFASLTIIVPAGIILLRLWLQ